MKSIKSLGMTAIAASLMSLSLSSQAAIIYSTTQPATGTGFGTVNTVLALDNNNQTGLASGSVTRSGGADVFSGNVKESQTATFSFGQLGITNANQIAFLFNASEQGGNNITVTSLVFSIYSATGSSALFSTALAGSQSFANTVQGVGGVGFLFVLDTASTLAAQSFITAGNRVGLAASLTSADGGVDSFSVGMMSAAQPISDVPEPASMLLIGLGLLGLGAARRRKA